MDLCLVTVSYFAWKENPFQGESLLCLIRWLILSLLADSSLVWAEGFYDEHLDYAEGISALRFLSRSNKRSKDKQDKAFKCHQCGKSYFTKQSLTRHLRVECGKLPEQQCPCGRKFRYKYDLQVHMRVACRRTQCWYQKWEWKPVLPEVLSFGVH